jgi:hypothetical protein
LRLGNEQNAGLFNGLYEDTATAEQLIQATFLSSKGLVKQYGNLSNGVISTTVHVQAMHTQPVRVAKPGL